MFVTKRRLQPATVIPAIALTKSQRPFTKDHSTVTKKKVNKKVRQGITLHSHPTVKGNNADPGPNKVLSQKQLKTQEELRAVATLAGSPICLIAAISQD